MTKELDDNDSLQKLQKYIRDINVERGFDGEPPTERMLLLMEELGELAKAVRDNIGMKFSDSTKRTELEEEIADVQILLIGLADMLNVDVYESVRKKELKNRQRTWS